MSFNRLLLFSLFAVFVADFSVAQANDKAEEKIGTFNVDQILLRPTFHSIESQGGQFDMDDSYFGVKWSKDKHLSAYIEVGALISRNLPIYYTPVDQSGYGFTQGYIEYSGVYGRIRYGLVPLGFGYDGSVERSARLFQWSQLFQSGLIGYDDMGLSLFTQHNGFYTELVMHNGEIEQAADGRLWATSNFGWTNKRDWRAQLSLQTGFVNGDQSLNSTNKVGSVNNGETAKWRNAALFVNYAPRDWNAVIEIAGGEVQQTSHTGGYTANRIELTRFFTKNFGAGARYDVFSPDTSVSQETTTASSLLLAFRSDDSTSTFTIVGTKNTESGFQINNDELRVSWVLTPFTR